MGKGKSSGFTTSYQGVGSASGKAEARGGSISDNKSAITANWQKYPKAASETAKQTLAGINSNSSPVTIYRAAPADHINTNDWVFLDRAEAERWAVSTFSKRPKIGSNGKQFKVLAVNTTAAAVSWSGKGDHFVYTGKRAKG